MDRDDLPPRAVIAVLAELIRGLGPATCCMGGRLGIRVHGELGGIWSCDLSVPGGAWAEHADEGDLATCRARIFAFAETFPALLAAPDRIEDLLETGELVVEDDDALLPRLGRLMSAGGTALEQRSSRSRSP